MIRMNGADAFMLSLETPRAYMHTLKIAILDPSAEPEGWVLYDYFMQELQALIEAGQRQAQQTSEEKV